jgi:hypothetical protein
MKDEASRQKALLASGELRAAGLFAGGSSQTRTTGLFEGANGYAKGVYRSEIDCVMFSLQTQRFCSACARAIERAIDAHILHR